MKVRRQHPVGPYVVDFCIERLLLVIELDGEIHREIPEHDAVRDAWLRSAGFTVLRIPNDEVFRDPAAVLKRIAETAAECAISHDDRAERSGSDSRA